MLNGYYKAYRQEMPNNNWEMINHIKKNEFCGFIIKLR